MPESVEQKPTNRNLFNRLRKIFSPSRKEGAKEDPNIAELQTFLSGRLGVTFEEIKDKFGYQKPDTKWPNSTYGEFRIGLLQKSIRSNTYDSLKLGTNINLTNEGETSSLNAGEILSFSILYDWKMINPKDYASWDIDDPQETNDWLKIAVSPRENKYSYSVVFNKPGSENLYARFNISDSGTTCSITTIHTEQRKETYSDYQGEEWVLDSLQKRGIASNLNDLTPNVIEKFMKGVLQTALGGYGAQAPIVQNF